MTVSRSHLSHLLVFVCTAVYATAALAQQDTAIPAGKARVTITRTSAMLYMALSARVDINGLRVAELGRGDTYAGVFDPGKLVISTDHWSSPGRFTVILNAEAGAAYQLELSPREDSFLPGALFGIAGLAVDAAVESNAGLFKLVIRGVRKPAEGSTR